MLEAVRNSTRSSFRAVYEQRDGHGDASLSGKVRDQQVFCPLEEVAGVSPQKPLQPSQSGCGGLNCPTHHRFLSAGRRRPEVGGVQQPDAPLRNGGSECSVVPIVTAGYDSAPAQSGRKSFFASAERAGRDDSRGGGNDNTPLRVSSLAELPATTPPGNDCLSVSTGTRRRARTKKGRLERHKLRGKFSPSLVSSGLTNCGVVFTIFPEAQYVNITGVKRWADLKMYLNIFNETYGCNICEKEVLIDNLTFYGQFPSKFAPADLYKLGESANNDSMSGISFHFRSHSFPGVVVKRKKHKKRSTFLDRPIRPFSYTRFISRVFQKGEKGTAFTILSNICSIPGTKRVRRKYPFAFLSYSYPRAFFYGKKLAPRREGGVLILFKNLKFNIVGVRSAQSAHRLIYELWQRLLIV